MAERKRRSKERAGQGRPAEPSAAPFPPGPGESAKRGDPPIERPPGDRSRHGDPGSPGEDDGEQ